MRKIISITPRFLIAFAFTMLLAACGGGGGGSSSTGTVTTSSKQVLLPEEISIAGSPEGDMSGAMLKAGTSGEVAGFVSEVPALNNETTASEVLTNGVTTLDNSGYTMSALSVSKPSASLASGFRQAATLPQSIVVAQYAFTTLSAVTPTEVANEIIQQIGVNTTGGAISGLPTAPASSPTTTTFRCLITIMYYDANTIIILVSVVPENQYDSFSTILVSLGDGTNVTDKGASTSSQTDSFTATEGGGKADFLFVVDNSGSMGGEQTAVSNAATSFTSRMSTSGLDFMMGIVTTDSSTLVDGDFTASTTVFESRVVVGTSGSSYESGIYHAEEALDTGGSATALGYPRTGASMSVIMISDERDQYTSYSSNVSFDVSNNLFVTNSYKVYSIINFSDTNSQYEPLASATGGSSAEIGSDCPNCTSIMGLIATNAGAASSTFVLSQTPLSGSIKVSVNGTTVANDATNGYGYFASTNTIVFYGTAIPNGGDTVTVKYDYVV